jgi:hypothetical protein
MLHDFGATVQIQVCHKVIKLMDLRTISIILYTAPSLASLYYILEEI